MLLQCFQFCHIEHSLPATKAACIFHKGAYADFPQSYEIILKNIEENGLEIAGPIREKYIDGEWNKNDES